MLYFKNLKQSTKYVALFFLFSFFSFVQAQTFIEQLTDYNKALQPPTINFNQILNQQIVSSIQPQNVDVIDENGNVITQINQGENANTVNVVTNEDVIKQQQLRNTVLENYKKRQEERLINSKIFNLLTNKVVGYAYSSQIKPLAVMDLSTNKADSNLQFNKNKSSSESSGGYGARVGYYKGNRVSFGVELGYDSNTYTAINEFVIKDLQKAKFNDFAGFNLSLKSKAMNTAAIALHYNFWQERSYNLYLTGSAEVGVQSVDVKMQALSVYADKQKQLNTYTLNSGKYKVLATDLDKEVIDSNFEGADINYLQNRICYSQLPTASLDEFKKDDEAFMESMDNNFKITKQEIDQQGDVGYNFTTLGALDCTYYSYKGQTRSTVESKTGDKYYKLENDSQDVFLTSFKVGLGANVKLYKTLALQIEGNYVINSASNVKAKYVNLVTTEANGVKQTNLELKEYNFDIKREQASVRVGLILAF